MQKRLRKISSKLITKIFLVIVGGIIFGVIGVSAANIIASNTVSYDNTNSGASSTTVQDAIDELYSKMVDESSGKKIIAVVSKYNVSQNATVNNVVYYNSDYVSVSNGVFTVKKAATFSFAGAGYVTYAQAIVNGSSIGSWHFSNSPKVQADISIGGTFYFKDSGTYSNNHIFGVVWID